jgi:hypothetical protein
MATTKPVTLVERLRDNQDIPWTMRPLRLEAADEIERLQRVMHEIVKIADTNAGNYGSCSLQNAPRCSEFPRCECGYGTPK